MPNFYLPPSHIRNDQAVFPETEAHHIAHVKRHRPGDIVSAVDGCGRFLRVELTAVSRKAASGRVVESGPGGGEPSCHVALAQALPKNRKIDLTIEKGTEIGVAEFIPFISERTVKQSENTPQRLERWQQLAVAAMKQSGRSRLPQIQPIQSLPQLIALIPTFDQALIAHPTDSPTRLQPTKSGQRILIIIGPEGGFSSEEIAALMLPNVRLLSLGERVLRTETAGLVCASLIIYHDLL